MALIDWERRFNAALAPAGVLIKTQSTSYITKSRQGLAQWRHTRRWVAVAVVPETVAALAAEPRLFGHVQPGVCGQPDERLCPVHP